MKVLITGGFGYLGGRIAQALATKDGVSVILGSRSARTPPDWLPNVETVQLDLLDLDHDSLYQACLGINCVIHAAGMNAGECTKDPVAALEINGVATARLARESKRAGVSEFIYLSTVHVYGAPLSGTINEETCPRNMHPYATSHLAGEFAVLNESSLSDGFRGTVLRLSNVVASPADSNANCWMLVATDLCRQVVVNKGILHINSPPSTSRDYVSVTHLTNVVWSCLIGKNSHQLLNVSSGNSWSLMELSTLISVRSKNTLNLNVLVEYNNIYSSGISENLSIESRAVQADKYSYLTSEIDRLLIQCQNWFGERE